ncbi:MAG: DUF192 domain-containing protein [Sinobacteraceae bacterium]|nr:DUF192 domain-containing protein [Nevskiaceae bacterium]
MDLPRLYIDGQRTDLRVCVAWTFAARTFGMLRSLRWQRFDVLCLPRCTAVHTCFVPVPIDVLFVDRRGRVLQIEQALPPWRIALLRQADSVWELPAGFARACSIERGSRLQAWPSC